MGLKLVASGSRAKNRDDEAWYLVRRFPRLVSSPFGTAVGEATRSFCIPVGDGCYEIGVAAPMDTSSNLAQVLFGQADEGSSSFLGSTSDYVDVSRVYLTESYGPSEYLKTAASVVGPLNVPRGLAA